MNRQAVTFEAATKVNLAAGQLVASGADYAIDVAAIGAVTPAQMAAADAVVTAAAAADATAKANAAQAASQPVAANLTAFAALVGAADRLPYFTAASTLALATFTAFGRTVVGAATASAAGLAALAGAVFTGIVEVSLAEAIIYITSTNTGNGMYLLFKSGTTLVGGFQAGGTSMAGYVNKVRLRAYRPDGSIEFTTGGVDAARVIISSAGLLTATLGLTVAGNVTLDKTITAPGTTGAQTINKPSGRVNFAAGATSLVVTCNLCTANSIVTAMAATNDATGFVRAVVPAAGSFTIYGVAPTAEMACNFRLTN